MAGAFNEQTFEQRLVNLKDTQESINSLSSWCLQNKQHHKKIVTCWLHCLKRVKVDKRLSLFHLANDVIQYSKRKHLDFVDSWGTALQKATPLVRDDKVRNRVMRIFKIWEERGIYDEAFISDLCGLLTTNVKKKEEPEVDISDPADFQQSGLFKKIRECKVLEENTDVRYRRMQEFKLPLTDAESMRISLKDRRHGSDVAAEVDSGVKKMEAYVKALETEISSREKLVDMLRQAMVFYETLRGEAKIVANAYRNYSGRLKAQLNALDEQLPALMSPLPSPDVNAPSPSPDPDLEGDSQSGIVEPPPMANGGELDFSFSSSFLGSTQIMDLHKEVFNSSNQVNTSELEGPQSIEVISNRLEPPDQGFNVAEFLKSLMPSKDSPLQPPPMPPMFGDWRSGTPWAEPPPETPQSPPLYEKQVPLVQPVEYDDSLPVPLVPDIDHRPLLPIPIHTAPPLQPMSMMDTDQRILPPPVVLEGPSLLSAERPMEFPPALVMEPPPRLNLSVPPSIDHIPGLDLDSSMDSSLSLSLGLSQPNLDHLVHIAGLSMDRGAILTGPSKGIDTPKIQKKTSIDIDLRNLISLTGSPTTGADETPHKMGSYGYQRRETEGRFGKDVNVESVDMDVSEEEDETHFRNSGQDGLDRRIYALQAARRTEPLGEPVSAVQHVLSELPSVFSTQEFPQDATIQQGPAFVDQSLGDLQCVGAKLIAPVEHLPSPESNGHPSHMGPPPGPLPSFHPPPGFPPMDFTQRPPRCGEFSPRPRWRSPRPNFPYRTPPPFRGHFRPRGRW